MRRKCYSAYKTCHKYQQAIKCNLKNAIVVLHVDSNPGHSSLSVLVPSPKRPRIGWSSSSSGANRSPDVLVGACMMYSVTNEVHTLLLYYQIRVGYTKPKTFTLTPNRKCIGKAIARNQHITIAREALANPLTKKLANSEKSWKRNSSRDPGNVISPG